MFCFCEWSHTTVLYVCLREGKKHLLPFLREPTCVHHKQSCFLLPFSRPGGLLVGKFKYVYCVHVCFPSVNFCARGALYLVLNSYMYIAPMQHLRVCNNIATMQQQQCQRKIHCHGSNNNMFMFIFRLSHYACNRQTKCSNHLVLSCSFYSGFLGTVCSVLFGRTCNINCIVKTYKKDKLFTCTLF